MSAAERRTSNSKTLLNGARRMPVDDRSEQSNATEPDIVPAADGDLDVTMAAPVMKGATASDTADRAPSATKEPLNGHETTTSVPASPADVIFPRSPTPAMQPPSPANYPPPVSASANVAGPNSLTHHDLAVPRPPQGWQRTPGAMPRQPVQHPFQGQPVPSPSPTPPRAPWQAASSWGATTLSIQATTAAGASYLFWWVSGVLVYFNERHNRFVRFHAMQSVLLTGALTAYGVLVYLVAGLLDDLAVATNQHAFHTLGTAIAAASFFGVLFLWFGVMVAAWTGHYFRIPIVGAYAERYAAPPAQPPPF